MLSAYFGARSTILIILFALGSTVFIVLLKNDTETADSLALVAVISISVFLLLSTTLASNNLSGADVNEEFYLFSQILERGTWLWNAGFGNLPYNSALSITILPTVLSIVSSLDGLSIFKFVLPILFSLVPVMLYKSYRQILAPSASFMAVFLFMSYSGFIDMPSLGRQEIAEILLVLLMMFSLSGSRSGRGAGIIVTMILSLGLIVAHYSIAYIFLFLMLVSIAAARIFPDRAKRFLDKFTLLLWGVAALAWYAYISAGLSLLGAISSFSLVLGGLGGLSNPATRPAEVQLALAFNATVGPLHLLNRAIQYLVVMSLIIGFFVLLKRKNTNAAQKKILPLMAGSLSLMLATVALPSFGSLLNFSRFFHIALLFVSPCFPIGIGWLVSSVGAIFRVIPVKRVRITFPDRPVAAALLFSYLLFSSGWVWAVAMDPLPTSVTFDWNRMRGSEKIGIQLDYYGWYIVGPDKEAALWLKMYSSNSRVVCADYVSIFHVLAVYDNRDPIQGDNYELGQIPFVKCTATGSYLYLSVFNTVSGYGTGYGVQLWPVAEYSNGLSSQNRIFSDGATVYQSAGT